MEKETLGFLKKDMKNFLLRQLEKNVAKLCIANL